MDEKRTLILGARSLVGDFLGPRLIEHGWPRPLALSRRPPAASSALEFICGDLLNGRLGDDLPPISCVISLCPIWLLPPSLPVLLDTGVRRVIAFSSTSRTTKRASPDFKERAVALALERGEETLMGLCEAAGASWTILRPTLIYAEGQDGNVSRLAALIRRFGCLPLAGDGGGLRQPVHADDLAQAVISAAASPHAANRAYDLVGGETLSYRVMVERIFEGLGRPTRIISIPPAVWALAFTLGRPFLPGATQAMGARMSQDLVFDDHAARRDFGWRPRDFHPRF